jgi:hypothetical protein
LLKRLGLENEQRVFKNVLEKIKALHTRFSPLERERSLEFLRWDIDTFVKGIAPYLQDGKNAAMDSRLKDFCDLAEKWSMNLKNTRNRQENEQGT